MLYALYHLLTDTQMDDNGLPWYIDTLMGIVDLLILVGVLYALTPA